MGALIPRNVQPIFQAGIVHSRVLPVAFGDVRIHRRQITGELDRVVEAGQLDGSFDVADVRLTTNSLLSLGIDISRWYQDSSRISPQQIADHHVHLALRMVGARPRALVPGRRPRSSPRGQAT